METTTETTATLYTATYSHEAFGEYSRDLVAAGEIAARREASVWQRSAGYGWRCTLLADGAPIATRRSDRGGWVALDR